MNRVLQLRDREPLYSTGEAFAFCGENEYALDFLRLAVQGNYCSYPALDLDPVFAAIRNTPEFRQIRQEAIACQQRFVRFPAQLPP